MNGCKHHYVYAYLKLSKNEIKHVHVWISFKHNIVIHWLVFWQKNRIPTKKVFPSIQLISRTFFPSSARTKDFELMLISAFLPFPVLMAADGFLICLFLWSHPDYNLCICCKGCAKWTRIECLQCTCTKNVHDIKQNDTILIKYLEVKKQCN